MFHRSKTKRLRSAAIRAIQNLEAPSVTKQERTSTMWIVRLSGQNIVSYSPKLARPVGKSGSCPSEVLPRMSDLTNPQSHRATSHYGCPCQGHPSCPKINHGQARKSSIRYPGKWKAKIERAARRSDLWGMRLRSAEFKIMTSWECCMGSREKVDRNISHFVLLRAKSMKVACTPSKKGERK